jgi:peptidoglycan hydrolase-like protein with peptidoglycan-binding domain
MDAYREAMYRGVTPGGYGIGKKLKEFVPNLVKNSMITPEERALGIMAEFKRPGMTANQLRDSVLREAYDPADAQRVLRNLQTKGEKRLDAFSLGVRGKQNFDTFEKIGKDTYRVKNSNLDPRSMVDIVNDFDSHVSMNQAGLYSGQHPLERLTQRAKEVSFRENGVPSEFIPNEEYVEPWFPGRLPKKDVKGNVVGVYDVDIYDMIRGGHSWDITPDVGDKTRTMTSFDEWDLHPLAGRGNTRVAEDKMRTIHPFKGMFKDVEFLKLMGGKPFKIQNKFDIDPKTFEIKKAYRNGGVVTDPGKDFIEQASSNAGLGQFNIPRVKSKNELTNEKTRQSVMVEQPVSVSGMTNLLPEVKVMSKRDAVRADIENKVIMKKEAKALAFMDSESIPGKDFVPEQRNYDAVPIMKHDSIKESTSVNFASPLSDSMIKKSIDVAEKPKVSVSDVPLIGNYEEVQKKRAIEPIKQFYKNYSEASKEEVVSLQKDLMSKGFELPKYGADGKFGDETKKAFEASLIEKKKQPAFLSEIKNELSKGSCESEHCATYVSEVLRLNVIGSAWEMKDNIERNRGRIKYNIYDDPRLKNANSPASLIKATKDVKSTSKAKPEMFEIGDVVGIAYYPSTHHQDALDGQRGGTKNTHVGTVTDIKNGVPIISHNIKGELHHDPYNKLTIGWIGSPNYKEVKPYENKFEKEVTDIDSAVDVYAKTMSKDFQVPVNPNVIKKDIEGILQVESGGGKAIPTQIDISKFQSQRWLLGKNNSRADISRGLAKLKMNTFSQQERDFLGLNEETIDDPVMGVKAATYLYLKHFNTFQKYAKSNPHLKLTNEDIREMTILSHNQGTSKLLNLGYISDKKSFDEEIESLRKLNKGKVSDISSSKAQYFGPLKKLVYDVAYPGGHDSYTSRVLKHGEKKYGAPSK